MNIQSIIVDEMPECCTECPLFSYKNDSFSYCAGLSNYMKDEFNEMPYLETCRRSNCRLITLKEIGETLIETKYK